MMSLPLLTEVDSYNANKAMVIFLFCSYASSEFISAFNFSVVIPCFKYSAAIAFTTVSFTTLFLAYISPIIPENMVIASLLSLLLIVRNLIIKLIVSDTISMTSSFESFPSLYSINVLRKSAFGCLYDTSANTLKKNLNLLFFTREYAVSVEESIL